MTTKMSNRDPYPFPVVQNDDNFMGVSKTQKLPYGVPTGNAQKEEPWQRLNQTPTLSSARREVYHFDPQAPRDSLDFILKGQYDHHNAFLNAKPETLKQAETLGLEHGRILKNRPEKVAETTEQSVTEVQMPQRRTIDSMHYCHNHIVGHHPSITNRGYSRKHDGGCFEY